MKLERFHGHFLQFCHVGFPFSSDSLVMIHSQAEFLLG